METNQTSDHSEMIKDKNPIKRRLRKGASKSPFGLKAIGLKALKTANAKQTVGGFNLKNFQLRKTSLNTQIIVMMLLITLIPISLITLRTTDQIHSDMLEHNTELLALNNEMIAQGIQMELDASKQLLEVLGNQVSLQSMLHDLQDGATIQGNKKYDPLFETLSNTIKNSGGIYETLFISDAYGNIITNNTAHKENYRLLMISNKPYFAELNATSRTYIGETMESGATGKHIIPFSYLIQDEDVALGAMVIFFDMESLLSGIPDNQKSIVYDEFGHIVHHYSKEAMMSDWNPKVSGQILTAPEGDEYFHVERTLGSTGWRILSLVEIQGFYASINSVKKETAIIAGILAVFVFIIAVVYSSMLLKPLHVLADNFRRLADGQLNLRVDEHSNKEIEKMNGSFNEMVGSLQDLMKTIHQSADDLKEASMEMGTVSDIAFERTAASKEAIGSIAVSTSDSVAEMQTGVASLQTIACQIDVISANSMQAVSTLKQTENESRDSMEKVTVIEDNAEKSSSISRELMSEMKCLMSSVENIDQINDTITKISKQTNLLALNASIEAARAGEHGLGFSVVANQVRELSDMIARETKSIQKIIGELRGRSATVETHVATNEAITVDQKDAIVVMNHAFDRVIRSIEENNNRIYEIIDLIEQVSKEKDAVIDVMTGVSGRLSDNAGAVDKLIEYSQEQFSTIKVLKVEGQRVQSQARQLRTEMNRFELT
ncbi:MULTISPECIES: methyl-accepting chemotaxis protein [unclassified Fusibacter]|uniref:methyl-accepting chemotaxis protein n=1 Tax=unclassified Fusibacter TaxID=2624464 RepID=UPI0010139534|nr:MULTISPECIES: methyl-accepting chemotaxis protein [unclassified Fusibacter]MCK8060914.1 methyl-accepting chemotaxis protein [Fusibacter sp. A2]NPE23210.1 methyl-accepting chemotaxis protein [Fusibacter sp. A1]RXV59566.1 methyl-accepting chemotaxis protein [Fusibacter sp. A1]